MATLATQPSDIRRALKTSYGAQLPISVRCLKRSIDLTVSTAGLLLVAWLFPLLALAIYIDSPGPIFYRQRRAGRLKGRSPSGAYQFSEFDMLKFRTMQVGAERSTGAVLASENDPRVTRVGRLLRKTRLDELPQLLSVLKGDMALVGPRPERPELFHNLISAIPFFEERMRGVKPGITGLAQISLGYTGKALPGTPVAQHEGVLTNPFEVPDAEGAPADDMRMKLLFDLAYVAALTRFSVYFRTELYVILRTPWIMLRGLGR